VTNLADGLLVTDALKTLAEIQRQFASYVDPSNIADTFRIAPWTAADIREPLARLLMQTAAALCPCRHTRWGWFDPDLSGSVHEGPIEQGPLRCLWVGNEKALPGYKTGVLHQYGPHTALQWYAKRWNCEIDNFYLKERLGPCDFRLQSYEAIDKFCTVVDLAWAYVQ
jgi:hypothetical protein